MGYRNLSKNVNDLNEILRKKRKAEKTALDSYSSDLKGLCFTVGETDASMATLGVSLALVVPIILKLVLRRKFSGEDMTSMWAILAIFGIILAAVFINQKYRAKISVKEKELIYKGNTWADYQISHVVLPSFGGLKIYSGGKVIAKAGYAEENSELLIAWFHRCHIIVEDNRPDLD